MAMPDFKALRRSIEAVVGQHVRLRRQGRAYVGRCPFHDDRGRPNLTVYPDTQTYICYVCRARGDAVDFVARLDGLTQGQAARRLSGQAGAVRPPLQAAKPRDPDHLDLVYRLALGSLDLSERHRQNLRARGLTEETIHARGYRTLESDEDRRRAVRAISRSLGEDAMRQVPGFGIAGGQWVLAGPDGLLVPVLDAHGRIVGIQVRTSDPKRKYRWLSTPSLTAGASSGSPAHVANPSLGHDDLVWVTEGPLKADVVAAKMGRCAVAAPGVAAWRRCLPMIQEIKPRTVIVAFDQDEDPATAMAVGQHTLELARTLRRSCRVAVASWARGKGIDDALALGSEIHVEALT
jgi:DNA primase